MKSGLIVSFRALAEEPSYGANIMRRMADATKEGIHGVKIKRNHRYTTIKDYVNLPVIELLKRNMNPPKSIPQPQCQKLIN